jgi:hypothetical protein
MVTTTTLRRWSLLGASLHEDFLSITNNVTIAARRQLALAAVVIVWWSNDLDVIFYYVLGALYFL